MRKRVSLDWIFDNMCRSSRDISYEQQYQRILALISESRIVPLKASGTNGKHPALYREYWLIVPERDYRVYEEELKYRLHPSISIDYYLSHLKNYEQERAWVLMLSEYLERNKGRLDEQESVNERSFEIWHREKFLSREQGRRILKHCGLDWEFLNIYRTTEPLAYYSHTRHVPQNMVILENKDTFYSMRRHLLKGNDRILGMKVGTLVYGAGKGILRSFLDFDLCVEPYMRNQENRIYYFGDLDYEGIGIYEKLTNLISGEWKILPFTEAYEAMLRKSCLMEELPGMKEQQNRNISEMFFSYFSDVKTEEMKRVLESGKYIPQEILNIADFESV